MNIYYKDIIERIHKNYSEMTDTERLVADFFLANDKKQDFTAKTISKKLHVSETVLSRFAKKLGFSGYREFQYLYEINFHIQQYGNHDFVQRILDTYDKLLQGFNGSIPIEEVRIFTKRLTKAKRIIIYGLGSSACAATEFRLRFMRLGLQVEVVDNPHLMQMSVVLMQQEDMAIGMSLSGETREVLAALRAAASRGVWVTLITANKEKQLRQDFAQVLQVPSIDGLSMGDNISPQFPILILSDIIYSVFMEEDSKYKTAIFQDTLSAIRQNDRDEGRLSGRKERI